MYQAVVYISTSQYENVKKLESTKSVQAFAKDFHVLFLAVYTKLRIVSAPKVWNTLPLHIGQSQSLSTFRRHLKTHYFQLAYPAT